MGICEKTSQRNEPRNNLLNEINEHKNLNKENIKNELKIELYPENQPRYDFKVESIKKIINRGGVIAHSFDINEELSSLDSNVPLLNGFYIAHTNHYPIRLKPDDIWLLIIQSFSNHVNANSEKLRKYFVDFNGKKELTVNCNAFSIRDVDKKILENFTEQINVQMKKYLGEQILEILTPSFTTTTYDSTIICKMSIMGAFKKYFKYTMRLAGCGIPYIILEGTAEDYKKIIDKAEKLSKYEFEWYINRIIPHLKKMVEAKEGKIDIDYFKNIIQKKELTEIKRGGGSGIGKNRIKVELLTGWILNFFAYYKENSSNKEVKIFPGNSIKVKDLNKLANQILVVSFKIIESKNKKEYLMKYKVGFVRCKQNKENEVYPVQGWLVSPSTDKERNSIL